MKLIAGILSENYPTVQYFLLKLRTRFVQDFFFVSILNYLQKLRPGFYTLDFYIFH